MGPILSRLLESLLSTSFVNGDTSTRILMLGLDGAGKTTILYKVKLNENVCTIPTIGFNAETVTPVKGVTFTVWDIGGQEKIRALWRHYYTNAEGLLFIVDSADVSRIGEAREELFHVLQDVAMCHVPVVVIANKQDLPGALSTAEVADKLCLRNMRDRKWYVQGTCTVSGDGIYEGMQEMARLVKESKKK